MFLSKFSCALLHKHHDDIALLCFFGLFAYLYIGHLLVWLVGWFGLLAWFGWLLLVDTGTSPLGAFGSPGDPQPRWQQGALHLSHHRCRLPTAILARGSEEAASYDDDSDDLKKG